MIARLARRRHGVVTRWELAALGLTRGEIEARLASGHLHAVHRGVYAVGHLLLSREARWLAAVLACGPEAVLSHESAAECWGLLDGTRERVHVTVPARSSHRARRGIAVHRARALDERDRARRHAIPLTAPARTVSDLAPARSPHELERILDRGQDTGLLTPDDLVAALDGGSPRPGHRKLRALVADRLEGAGPTRSRLERRFLALCRAHGLPEPQVNRRRASATPDFAWPSHRLLVETDGFEHHGTRTAFEDDRARDARQVAAGWSVLRFTWRQVTREPATTAERLRDALGHRAPGHPPAG